MTFSVSLMPADLYAPLPHYRAAIEQAVQAEGGRLGSHGAVRLPDGGQFVFADNQLWVGQFTPGICRVLFDAAVHTNTYLDNGGSGSDLTPLEVRGSNLKTPRELGPAIIAENPDALCVTLRRRLADWNRDMGRMRREGTIGADDQPLEPPPDPGTEPRVYNDRSGLAADCNAYAHKTTSGLGQMVMRSSFTLNARWGPVWRADIGSPSDPSTWSRISCWRVPGKHGKGGTSISERPLEMFDKSQNVSPLSK